MKKTIMAAFFIMVLTGCSAVNEVSNGLNYVPEATEYINEVQQFSKEVSAVAEKAVNDPRAREELENLLGDLKADISEFSDLTPPSLFEDIHNQVLEHSNQLKDAVDQYSTAIKEGKLSTDLLEQSGLLDDIAVYNDLLSQIKKLGE